MSAPTAAPRVAYTVPEAAASLALCEATTWKLVRSGELRSFKVGAARRVPATALEEFVQARLADDVA
ncbi:helix-turn-helix domain-containing protein [Nocardiopsis synnemataformans]|uniref:helix-turn-helix domain-containing protein n=1 Tax=Nocardiopsis synnemataformans TaxID=61305 RepID=UPI003EBCFFBF